MADKLIPDPTNRSLSGTTLRRWAEVRPGEFAPEVKSISSPATVNNLWVTTPLLAASGSAVSGWFDVSQLESLYIMRNWAGGAYAFEIDWSRDGVAVDIVEVVATSNNVPLVKPVAAKFARFRVRNTDAISAFTTHLTVVNAR